MNPPRGSRPARGAAGNDNTDACNRSPARVSTAFTVGAITAGDARAAYSSYGACLDVFAPGSSILSTLNSSNTATGYNSGTSLAAPHVAGVAALVLDESPNITTGQLINDLRFRAVTGAVGNPGTSSPNRLLQSLSRPLSPPVQVQVIRGLCFGLNDIFWSSVPGATYYQRYASTSSSFSSQSLIYSGSGTGYGLDVDSTQYLRVRACNASGCGVYRAGNFPATYTNGCF